MIDVSCRLYGVIPKVKEVDPRMDFDEAFADNIRVLLEKPVDDTLIMIIEPMSLTVEDEGLPEGEFL